MHPNIVCIAHDGKCDTADMIAEVWPIGEEFEQGSGLLRVLGYEVLV